MAREATLWTGGGLRNGGFASPQETKRRISNAKAICLAVGFKDGKSEIADFARNDAQRAEDQHKPDVQRSLANPLATSSAV